MDGEELCGEREVMLQAVRQDGFALAHASQELRGDLGVVTEAVRFDGRSLAFASEDLRGCRAVVLEAVRCKGFALFHASTELRADAEVVLEAVRQAGAALQFASEDLLGDPKIVLEAVRRDAAAFKHVSAVARRDKRLQPEAAQANPLAFPCCAVPIVSVSQLAITPVGIGFRAALGLAGREVEGVLPDKASLADLARELLSQLNHLGVGHCRLHLVLPGAEGPADPLAADNLLSSFMHGGESH